MNFKQNVVSVNRWFSRNRSPDERETYMPQAELTDQGLQSLEDRNWREHFTSRLSGKGLEIGPLHRPMLRHSGMEIDYFDRYTLEELRQHYPDLEKCKLVEPDIVGDAQDMASVPKGQYDFLISSHVIEHMRNPIAALEAWLAVLRPGGRLYLVVPDKRGTFDKTRVRTTLAHMILDYYSPSEERDFEHYLDYAVHVHKRRDIEGIKEAELLIERNYSIHFHVFLPIDMAHLIDWFSANVRPVEVLEGPCMAPGADEFHFLLEALES